MDLDDAIRELVQWKQLVSDYIAHVYAMEGTTFITSFKEHCTPRQRSMLESINE